MNGIHDMLSERLRVKLPAARAEFEARCLRAWARGMTP
jgi:hypothetical protein